MKKRNGLFFMLLTFALLALSSFYVSCFTVAAEKKVAEITCEVSPQIITFSESVNISGRLTDLSTDEGLQRMINITYSEDNGTTWIPLKETLGELVGYGDDIWTNETGHYGPYTWKPKHIPHNVLVRASYGGDEAYEPVKSSVQSLTVELPPNPAVEILSHRSYVWYNTTLWIAGEVQNVGTTNLELVGITAVYYNSVGSIIGTDGFYIQLRVITPGQKSPFITFAGISYPRPINASLIADYEVVVRAYWFTTEPYVDLQIVSQEARFDEWDNYHVSGEIKNNDTISVESVVVVATYYDSDHRVVDAWFDLPDPSHLSPNETATFDIELDKSRLDAVGVIDHYALQVDYYRSRTPSAISCSVSSLKMTLGEFITISGSISPALGEVNVTLTFTRPDNTSFTGIVTTTSEGSFTYTFEPENSGVWSVKASWPGDIHYEGTTSTSASFTVEKIMALVRETPSPETAAVATTVAVAVSAGFTALMSLTGLGQSFSSALLRLGIPDWLKDFLQPYFEEMFETVSEEELKAMKKAPLLTGREMGALGISALVATIVFGYVEANGLPRFLEPSVLVAVIPLTLLTAGIIVVAEEFFGALMSKVYKIRAEFKIWLYGLIAFLVSGLLFMVPFSTPGISRYEGDEASKKISGLILVLKMLLLLTLLIPFSALVLWGFRVVGDTGLFMSLMMVFYLLIPLKPLEGKEVFDYNKKVWLAIFAPVLILFYAWVLNLLPSTVYLAVGFISALVWIITFHQTRPR